MDREKNPELKVCVPAAFSYLLEINNNKLSGLFARQASPYIKLLEKNFNATLTFQLSDSGLGERIGDTDSYNGCLGMLQRGEADLITQTVDYPLDIVNISQGSIVFDERATFIGVFARPDSMKAADFARCIYNFEWRIYLLIFSYLVLFAIVFKVRSYMKMHMQKSIIMANGTKSMNRRLLHTLVRRIKRKSRKSSGFLDIVRHFAQTNFIEENSYFVAVITTVLTLFSFFILAYFNSLLNTDLVIPNKAKMYENYDELMENNVKPLFIKGMSYQSDLKNSANGSKGKLFYEWAVKKFGEENLSAKSAIESFANHTIDMVSGEKVLFVGDIIAMTFKTTICDMLDRDFEKIATVFKGLDPRPLPWHLYEDSQAYARYDDSAPNKIKSMMVGKRIIESEKYFSIAKLRFNRFVQAGLILRYLKTVANTKLLAAVPYFSDAMGPPLPERLVVKYRCKENDVPVPKPPKINRLRLINFQFSFYACLFLLFCALLVLAYEKVLHKCPRIPKSIG